MALQLTRCKSPCFAPSKFGFAELPYTGHVSRHALSDSIAPEGLVDENNSLL